MGRDVTRNASLGGAVAAALAASACCVGPLIFALLGIGGAGFLIALEPYRPVFTGLTLGLLAGGWYLTYKSPLFAREPAGGIELERAAAECDCAMPRTNRAGKRLLWAATGLASMALAFPYLTPFLF